MSDGHVLRHVAWRHVSIAESSREERSAQVSRGEKPSVELPALPIEISNWIGLSANL